MRPPPLPGTFDVRRYGATGDGVTDDTTAINRAVNALTDAGGGVLLFPFGQYKTTGGHTISVPCKIEGQGQGYYQSDGSGGYDFQGEALSLIKCSSATAFAFTFTTPFVEAENLSVHVTATTPTAGGAFKCQGDGSSVRSFSRYQFRNVTILDGYYGIEHAVGSLPVFDSVTFNGQRKYMLYLRNDANADNGDGTVIKCNFVASQDAGHTTEAAIRYESGGGLKVVNTKFVGPNLGHALWLHYGTGASSGQLYVNNVSVDGIGGNAIRLETAGTGEFFRAIIGDSYLTTGGASAVAVYINNGGASGSLSGILVDNCHLINFAAAQPAITVTGNGGVSVQVGGVTIGGAATGLYTKGAGDTVIGGWYESPGTGLLAAPQFAGTLKAQGLDLQNTYGATAGLPANIKFFVYNDGTSKFGQGVSPGTYETHAPANSDFAFYLGGTLSATFGVSGVGFNGHAPVGKATLNSAATDAASTQALTNQIRTALINLGLAQ